MANEVHNSSISISRLYSNQYQKSGYKFLQNRQIKPSASNVGLLQAPISWSTHAQHVLCERISAVMQAHNSCCAAYGVNFSDNLYYLFRQLHLSFPTTSSVFCDCILRIILWYHTLACISIPSSFCSSTRLVSELVGAKAPNTTLSAMLMMYLFLAKALCLELRGRWEREILAYKEFIFVTMQKYE